MTNFNQSGDINIGIRISNQLPDLLPVLFKGTIQSDGIVKMRTGADGLKRFKGLFLIVIGQIIILIIHIQEFQSAASAIK